MAVGQIHCIEDHPNMLGSRKGLWVLYFYLETALQWQHVIYARIRLDDTSSCSRFWRSKVCVQVLMKLLADIVIGHLSLALSATQLRCMSLPYTPYLGCTNSMEECNHPD